MANILEVQGIHTFIGQFHILEGVSVSVPTGSITVLLGRNGAGKTTTLKSIMGMTPPGKGTITFEGRSLLGKRSVQHRAVWHRLCSRTSGDLQGLKRGGKPANRRAQSR